QCVDMDFIKAIPIVVACILTGSMVDALVLVAPFGQTVVNVVLVSGELTSWGHRRRHHRFDRFLLHVGSHPNDDVTVSLQQAQDGWFLVGQRPTAPFAFEPSPTPLA